MRFASSLLCTCFALALTATGCLLDDWDANPVAPESPGAQEPAFCFSCPGDTVTLDHPMRTWPESSAVGDSMKYTTVAVFFTGGPVTWKDGVQRPGPYTFRLAGDPFGWGDGMLRGAIVTPNSVQFSFPCPSDTVKATVVRYDSTGTDVVGWDFVLPCPAKYDRDGESAYRWDAQPGRVIPLPYP